MDRDRPPMGNRKMRNDARWPLNPTAARAALQCHGAIGYTTEHDLHLYMKRAWALAATWGDAHWHRERVWQNLETT